MIERDLDKLPADARLNMREVMALYGVTARSTIYRWMREGLLPQPIDRRGPNRWRVADVRAALAKGQR